MSANRGARLSFGWNSLRFGRDLLKTCLQFTIGNGEHTKLGIDLWLPTIPLRPPTLKRGTDLELQVRTLFDPTNQQWNEQQIYKFIDPIDHYLIRKIYLPQRPTRDGYIWSYTKDGNYTVKSGYWKEIEMNLMNESPTPPLATNPDIAKNIWKLEITPKLKHFMWRAVSEALGVTKNLRRQNINVNPYCLRCYSELETSNHTFFTCSHIKPIWRSTGIPTQELCDPSKTTAEKARYLLKFASDENIEKHTRFLPFWITWRIWKTRNGLVFNQRSVEQEEIVKHVVDDTKEWMDNITSSERQQPITQQGRGRKENGKGLREIGLNAIMMFHIMMGTVTRI